MNHMSVGYTTLHTGDGRRVVISNATILNQVMLNLGPAEGRARLVLPFTIKPAGDIERARILVTVVARANPQVGEVASCAVTSLAPDGTGMALTVWARDGATAERTTGELLEAVRGTLMASGLDPASGRGRPLAGGERSSPEARHDDQLSPLQITINSVVITCR